MWLHSSQGPNLKTTVTGVEMFKKQLDQGQVNLFKHELSLYGATLKNKDKKDLCVFPIFETLATSMNLYTRLQLNCQSLLIQLRVKTLVNV